MSALSMPMPNAIVATMTSHSPRMNASCVASRSSAAHPRVIRPRGEPVVREMRSHFLRGFLKSHIHHRRPHLRAGEPLREHRQPLARRARRHAQVQILPAERSLHVPLRCDAERLANIARHVRRRRRGEREHGPQRQLFRHAREPQILGTKIVSPLRDAMRLIDREQRDLHPPQPLEEGLAREPLRRDVEQLQFRPHANPHTRAASPPRVSDWNRAAPPQSRAPAAHPPGLSSAR